MFDKLPPSMAAIARCGAPSFLTKHKSKLFSINIGANSKITCK